MASDYLLGPTDLVSVFVNQIQQYTVQTRVSSGGELLLPYLSRPLPASGTTPVRLASEIQRELVVEGLARQPVVRVVVRQVTSKPITISGAVRYPMTLEATRPMSLLEVLSRAGGVDTAAASGRIIISSTGGHDSSPITIDLEDLLATPVPASNPMLGGGEEVRVEPARMIYVIGDFKKPGAFPVIAGEPMTVLRAVGLAGGMGAIPDRGNAVIMRMKPGAAAERQRVDIGALLKDPTNDPPLLAGDILYLPENGRRAALMQALTASVSTVSIAIGYGLSTVLFK